MIHNAGSERVGRDRRQCFKNPQLFSLKENGTYVYQRKMFKAEGGPVAIFCHVSLYIHRCNPGRGGVVV